MNALITGRVICGLGGIGIFVGGTNLLSVLTTEAERPIVLAFMGLPFAFGTVLGPIIGGAFADSSATWRWGFYLNLCVGAVVLPVYIFLIPSHHPHPGVSVPARLLEIDWIGSILCAGAFTSFVMAVAFGGALYLWSSGQIIGLFVCSAVLWILFIVQQALPLWTTKEHRLFPAVYLHSLEMWILFAQIAAGVVVVYVPLFFIPIYFEFVQNDTAFQAAIRLPSLVAVQVVGTILAGALLNAVGYYAIFYFIGGVLSLVGGALLHTTTIDTATSAIYGYSVLVGLGSGLYIQLGYTIAQLSVDISAIPRVISFIACGHITGITLALLLSNSIFLNETTNKIANILPSVPRATVQGAITGVGSTLFDTLQPAERALVLNAIVESIRNVYFMVIAASSLIIVLSLFMKREKISTAPKTTEKREEEGTTVDSDANR